MTSKTKRESRGKTFQFWSEHVQAWRVSGVSQRQYCGEHELGYKSFGLWKQKLSPSSSETAQPKPTFTTVRIRPEGDGENIVSSLCLHVGSRYRIEVRDGFNPSTLHNLLAALESI
jgi:hypothetical protein